MRHKIVWAKVWHASPDAAASRVAFTLHATLHRVEGSFRIQSGELSVDSATGEISGRIVVDARNGDTANAKRDAKMHGAVLETERFPEGRHPTGPVGHSKQWTWKPCGLLTATLDGAT
jgi:hypothetical protein